MSTRFGVELVLEPAFTARAYRTRNIVCGQYASWAAEMHMLRMSVISYFQCSDSVLDHLAHGVGQLAEESRQRSPRFSINCLGVASGWNGGADRGDRNNVFLEFQQTDPNHPLTLLQRDAVRLVENLPGADLPTEKGEFQAKINLIEYADLPPAVLADATDFAKGVAIDVGVRSVARAWRLCLLRYRSEGAGDDWSHGSWASDVRWENLSSYVL